MGEAKQLVSTAKARLKQDDLIVFDWDLTDRDQGIFNTKMMVFLWPFLLPSSCERMVLGKRAKVLIRESAQGMCPPHHGRR